MRHRLAASAVEVERQVNKSLNAVSMTFLFDLYGNMDPVFHFPEDEMLPMMLSRFIGRKSSDFLISHPSCF